MAGVEPSNTSARSMGSPLVDSASPQGEGHWVVTLRTVLRDDCSNPQDLHPQPWGLSEVPIHIPPWKSSSQGFPLLEQVTAGASSTTPPPPTPTHPPPQQHSPLVLTLRCEVRKLSSWLGKRANRSLWQADEPSQEEAQSQHLACTLTISSL